MPSWLFQNLIRVWWICRFLCCKERVLGGGSSVNGMIYMRGQARDFDDWEGEHGCRGRAYRDV